MSRNISSRSRKVLSTSLTRHSHRQSSQIAHLPWSIDIHTHMYLPRYMDHLRNRDRVPRVVQMDGSDRLLVFPSEESDQSTARGRPIGPEYYDINAKLEFMDIHRISHSVVSLANPWLDHVTDAEGASLFASQLNDDLQSMYESSDGRILGMAVLPINSGSEACVKEIERVHRDLSGVRGVVLGCGGINRQGLDSEKEMLDVYQCLSDCALPVFVHPHYGVGSDKEYQGYGHSLYLALGFPFETTVAVSRLLLSGLLNYAPNLRLVLAHASGALPMLLGRLQSCGMREDVVLEKLQGRSIRESFATHCFLDSITYDSFALHCAISAVGEDRLLFGTDHPFFPPTESVKNREGWAGEWPSTVVNQNCADELAFLTQNEALTEKILNGNARDLYGITDSSLKSQ